MPPRGARSNGRSRCAASCSGSEHADVAVTMVELGRVYQDRASTTAPSRCSARRWRSGASVLGDEHRETAVSMSDLASVLRLNGDLAGAEALLRQSLELNRKTRGERSCQHRHQPARPGADRRGARRLRRGRSAVPPGLDIHRQALGRDAPARRHDAQQPGHVLDGDRAATTRRPMRCRARSTSPAPALGAATISWSRSTPINLAVAQLARREPAARPSRCSSRGCGSARCAPEIVPSRRRTLPEDDWSVDAIKSLSARL